MKLLSDSFFILASFIFVFLWNQTPLRDQTIPLIGFLAFIYLLTNSRLTRYLQQLAPKHIWDKTNLFTLHTTVLLLVTSTGGITSSLFFLLYFLCFSISFILHPAAVFSFILGSILLFSPQAFQSDITNNTIRLGSIFLIAPLAYFFGKEIRLREKEEKKLLQLEQDTQRATNQITQDVADLIQNEGQNLKDQDIKDLKDIITQTKKLENESKNV
jgi:hypothetical protein